MKKYLFLLFTLLFILSSCNKDDDSKKIGGRENLTAVDLDKKELSITAGESHQFKVTYTPTDTSYYDTWWNIIDYQPTLDNNITKPTITEDGFLFCDHGCTLNVVFSLITAKGETLTDTCKVTYTVSKGEIYHKYCYDYAVKDTTGIVSGKITFFEPEWYSGDTSYLIGFKADTIWIGTFNNQTKEQIDEWIDTEPTSRVQTTYTIYGEYKEFTIKNAHVKNFIRNGDDIVLELTLTNDYSDASIGHTMLCFRKNGKTKKYIYNNRRGQKLQKWHENSYLANVDISEEPYIVIDNFYTCLADNGEPILSGTMSLGTFDQWYPVSCNEYLYVYRSNRWGPSYFINVYRRSISDEKNIWTTHFDAEFRHDVGSSPTLTEKNGDIWTFSIKVKPAQGREYYLIYDVNINDGTFTKRN